MLDEEPSNAKIFAVQLLGTIFYTAVIVLGGSGSMRILIAIAVIILSEAQSFFQVFAVGLAT